MGAAHRANALSLPLGALMRRRSRSGPQPAVPRGGARGDNCRPATHLSRQIERVTYYTQITYDHCRQKRDDATHVASDRRNDLFACLPMSQIATSASWPPTTNWPPWPPWPPRPTSKNQAFFTRQSIRLSTNADEDRRRAVNDEGAAVPPSDPGPICQKFARNARLPGAVAFGACICTLMGIVTSFYHSVLL
jgi:hypothetical protein